MKERKILEEEEEIDSLFNAEPIDLIEEREKIAGIRSSRRVRHENKVKIVEYKGEYYIPLKYFPWVMYPGLMAKGVYRWKGDRDSYVKLKDALPEIMDLIGEEETQKFLNKLGIQYDAENIL